MTLKQIIEMRGIPQIKIAEKLGTYSTMVTKWIKGERGVVGKYLQPLSEILDVSAAYLAGYPAKIPVYDRTNKQTLVASIIAENEIPGYGVFYLVEHPENELLSVIMSSGVQLTTKDRKGQQPMTVAEIKDYHWVDNRGNPTIMLDDGLPRTLFDFEHGKIMENNDK